MICTGLGVSVSVRLIKDPVTTISCSSGPWAAAVDCWACAEAANKVATAALAVISILVISILVISIRSRQRKRVARDMLSMMHPPLILTFYVARTASVRI